MVIIAASSGPGVLGRSLRSCSMAWIRVLQGDASDPGTFSSSDPDRETKYSTPGSPVNRTIYAKYGIKHNKMNELCVENSKKHNMETRMNEMHIQKD